VYAGLLVRSKEEEEEGEHNAPGRDERGKGGVGNGGGREGGRGAGRVDDKGEAGERVMHKADQVGWQRVKKEAGSEGERKGRVIA